jgi:polysaccharide transporter, PST family
LSIVKASILTSMATVARLLSGLMIVKFVAWYAGPEGVGRLGQFLSFVSLIVVLGGGGIGNGVVKYVAEYRNDSKSLTTVFGTALCFTVVSAMCVSIVAVSFSAPLASFLLQDANLKSLIWVLAAVQPFIAANGFLVSVINGYGDVRRVAVISIAGAFFSICLTGILAYFFLLYGALLAVVLAQALTLTVSLPLLIRSTYYYSTFLRMSFQGAMAARLARFSLMTLTSAILPPLTNLWIRNHLAAHFSWEAVGYWQAISKLSEAYLLFFTVPISVYYLPKMSSIMDRRSFERELRTAFSQFMPVVILFALGIYLFRGTITTLLFSERFDAAEFLYGPQLAGDVIKIASFLLSYVMVAKAMTTLFLISEFLFSISYIGLVFLLTSRCGLIGAMYAFTINYTLYFFFVAFITRRYVRSTL